MTKPILPEALKVYRKGKHWTQKKLADATLNPNKASEPTIKRIEGYKNGAYPARDSVATGLSKALGVTIDDLAKAPAQDDVGDEVLRKRGYRAVRAMVDAETALAFGIVEDLYGISIHSQIEMAPLFAALLAEGSLAWRRKRIDKIEDATSALWRLGEGHFSFAKAAASRAENDALGERTAIDKRDLFGKQLPDVVYDVGYDPYENNPFADYLEAFAKEADTKTVTFEKRFSWKTPEGLPYYRIGAGLIEHLTGSDPDAEYALLRGHVRLKDIPKQLLGDDKKDERVAWMIARIPSEELAAREAKIAADQARLQELLDTIPSKPDADEGGNDV